MISPLRAEKDSDRMNSLAIRGLLVAVAALVALALASVPAHATFTPVNTAVDFTGSGVLTDESTGLRTNCPDSDIVGRTSADGRAISGAFTFTEIPVINTCEDSLFRSDIRVTCAGSWTLRSTSSVAGTSSSGTVAFDSGFHCTFQPVIGSARSIRGPQAPSSCIWTFTQSTQALRVDCTTIAVDGGGESGFDLTYRVTSPRLTIS